MLRREDVFYRDVAVSKSPDDNESDDDGLGEDEPDDSDSDPEEDGDGEDDDGESNDPTPPAQTSTSPPPAEHTTAPAPSPVDPGLTGAVPLLGPLLNGLRFRVINSPHYIDFAPEEFSSFLSLQSREESVPLWLSGASSPAFILPPVGVDNNATSNTPPATTTFIVAAAAVTQTISVQATATAVVYVGSGQAPGTASFVAQTQSDAVAKPVGFTGLFFRSVLSKSSEGRRTYASNS